ncbi:unnamed protein product [Alopecurus aequalis]
MSSQPPTMADATGSLHRGIPDEIVVWEILVRLPPKALLRCRAVCPAWRRATSTRDFLLAHHARQPTLPILYGYEYGGGKSWQNIITFDHQAAAAVALPTLPLADGYSSVGDDGRSVEITPFGHMAGLAAADQLQPVTRLSSRGSYMHPEACYDGLLIHAYGNRQFSICNPATRQFAPLKQLYGFKLLGMYLHSPTGEYRLLLRKFGDLAPDHQDGSYVFTLGAGQPPRHIGYPEAEEVICTSSVVFGGNLHWHIEQNLSDSAGNLIMVFDTTAEVFWQMQAPAVPGYADLFEMGDMLGMASFNSAKTIIDIWVMQDYASEVWAFKCRIELPVEELRMQCVNYHHIGEVVVMPGDGELLVLVETEDWLHHVDIHGKLVASFHRSGLGPTQLRVKQTLVPHTFFPTLEGYVVNGSPFI